MLAKLSKSDLYKLVDAVGFSLRVGKRTDTTLPLEGSCPGTFKVPALGLNLPYTAEVIESHLSIYDEQTTGVRVRVLGALEVVFTFDHKRLRLEAYVIDGTAVPEKGLFEQRWSRIRFMFAVRNAIRTHYVWMDQTKTWEETPRAPRWVLDYLEAREKHTYSADDGLMVADLLAFDMLDRADPDLLRKWKVSTDRKRQEMTDEHVARRETANVMARVLQ